MGKLLMDSTVQSILTEMTRHNSALENSFEDLIEKIVNSGGSSGGTSGTSSAESLLGKIIYNVSTDTAGFHNSIFAGRLLGKSLSTAQSAAIQAGTFENLWIGDYWLFNEKIYRIADFDYFLHCGDTECTTHHVVLVPDEPLYDAVMNTTDITTGGYTGSAMYKTNLADAKSLFTEIFGSGHILSHKEVLCNAVASGRPSGYAWCASTVELMTEQMVYGGKVFGVTSDGSTVPHLYTVAQKQLNLFRLRPDLISNRNSFWLRDVISADRFACVKASGEASSELASTSAIGVRPAVCIY